MAILELSSEEVNGLVGTRHPITGIEYPGNGLQPYYRWLVATLHLMSESSFGALRVDRDDSGQTVVRVAPGRAVFDGSVVSYAGGTADLGVFNNETALIWVYDAGGGVAAVGTGSATGGWPAGAHVKLAEVGLEAGVITSVLDRRAEGVFRRGFDDGSAAVFAAYTLEIASQGDTVTPSVLTIRAMDLHGNPYQGVDYVRVRVCDVGGYANATDAVISAGTGTSITQVFTAGKDLVLQSDAGGVYSVVLTDIVAETVTLRIGAAPLSARRGDYSVSLNITH